MEKEIKEQDYADNVEITITSVEVRTNPNKPEEVSKIAFETSKGKITYKPKTQKEEYRDGLKILTTKAAKIEELPEVIKRIGGEIASKGNCIVTASYNLWNTDADGEPVTYRFVRGDKMMCSWVIVGNKEEKVS